MDIVLLTARVLLALVFGVAGVAKLADRAGSQQAFNVAALALKQRLDTAVLQRKLTHQP